MKARVWIAGWLIIVISVLGTMGYWTYRIDPFFHYHKPDTENYFYVLNNERSQNDGIIKHFDYNALITGTSMTENFKTSEMDEIFGTTSIKVPFFAATYKEINDNIKLALTCNQNLQLVIRCLDYGYFFDSKDKMVFPASEYPAYLYDSNLLNDVKYLINRDILWNRLYPIMKNSVEGCPPGMTSFDDYARWQNNYVFGINTIQPGGIEEFEPTDGIEHLTDEDRGRIQENIVQNVTSLANQYPDVEFYYFFSPYSILWWQSLVSNGNFYKWIEAEQYIIELILESENIHLFSFNTRFDVITDLNNYKDPHHYGEWVNSLILHWMHKGKYQLTKENYLDYLKEETAYYLSFDYLGLNGQADYENDFFVEALYHEEISGVAPKSISLEDSSDLNLKQAVIAEDQHDGKSGILCKGSLLRAPGSEYTLEESFCDGNYIGASVEIEDVDDYKYLVFWGQKLSEHGQPTVMIFNEKDENTGGVSVQYSEIDNEWHQYLIDITEAKGTLKIIFNGGYIDNTGSEDSTYVFSDIILY